jgi:hypothetical protein
MDAHFRPLAYNQIGGMFWGSNVYLTFGMPPDAATGAALALAYDATFTPFITVMLLCAGGAPITFVVATRLTAETATPFDGRTVEYP